MYGSTLAVLVDEYPVGYPRLVFNPNKERDELPLQLRVRLAALGVEENHADVARRLVAWDVQVAAMKRKHGNWLECESLKQLSLRLGPRSGWNPTRW